MTGRRFVIHHMDLIELTGAAFVAGTLAACAAVVEATAAAPVIFVYPNPATNGQQAVVYGSNFCGASTCSAITVTVDGVVVATGVLVKPDGTFAAGFSVTQMFGQHTVVASQTAADGSAISAVGGFRVAAGDATTPSPAAGTTPSSKPPSGGSGQPTPSRTSPSASTGAPAGPGAVGTSGSGTQAGTGLIVGVAAVLVLLTLVALLMRYVRRSV